MGFLVTLQWNRPSSTHSPEWSLVYWEGIHVHPPYLNERLQNISYFFKRRFQYISCSSKVLNPPKSQSSNLSTLRQDARGRGLQQAPRAPTHAWYEISIQETFHHNSWGKMVVVLGMVPTPYTPYIVGNWVYPVLWWFKQLGYHPKGTTIFPTISIRSCSSVLQ